MQSSSNTAPLLDVRALHSRYGAIEALHNVSFCVNAGEIVTLLGANGAGKSTTLMCISGVQPLSAGSISFDGRDLTTLAPHQRVRAGLAQVPEGRQVFPRLTVRENLLLGAYTRSDQAEIHHTEDRMYTLFPVLAERSKQPGGTLSGGEQQMVAIGRALMSSPRLLLLDEPSMGIAPLLVERIFETLAQLNREGLTVVLIEQNAHRALQIAQRGYVLETGKITLSGSAQQLRSDPRVQEAYLGA
jgi:branched-chain amino acid transport system ATP-binding protein